MLKPERDDLENIDIEFSNKEMLCIQKPEEYLAQRLKLFLSKGRALCNSGVF